MENKIEKEEQLVIMVMGQNCEDTIDMCLVSCKDSIIYFLDGGSTDDTLEIVKRIIPEENILYNKWDNKDIAMNGKQRNFYLNFLKEKHMDKWCLCLDADEVLEDKGIKRLKIIIEELKLKKEKNIIISPRIHHFVGSLGYEDATHIEHCVPNRFFKITEDLYYPEEDQHPTLKVNNNIFHCKADIHIWHFRECLGVFATLKKSLENKKKSKTHHPTYLHWWHRAMLFGEYPTKKVYYGEIPTIIKKRFMI